MKISRYIWQSLLHAAGVAAYVSAIAWFVTHSQSFVNKPVGVFGPILFLLLFVVSALITGLLVLARPVLLYMNHRHKEAGVMLFATLGWLIVFLLIAVLLVLVI